MTSYYVNDGSDNYSITIDSIDKILNGLNSCKFHCDEEFSVGTETLFYIKEDSTTIFSGYISDRTLTDEGWHSYTLTENAYTLKKRLVSSGGSYTFSVSSSTTTSTISTILSGSGWTNGSTNSTTINGVYFYYTNIWDALTKVITELSNDSGDNINMYFNSATKTVTYGKYNNDLTSSGNISYNRKDVKESDFDYNVDGIIVIGKDGSEIEGQYPSSITGDYIRVFQKKDLADNDEADALAQAIYNKFGSIKQRIEVHLIPTHSYQDGDLVSVDSSNYVVYDVKETMSETVLGLNSKNTTLKDLLGEDVYEISGYVNPGVYTQWDGGWHNIQGEDVGNGEVYPIYSYNVNDIDSIGEFKLTLECDSYKTASWLKNTNATLDIDDVDANITIDYLSVPTQRVKTMTIPSSILEFNSSDYEHFYPSSATDITPSGTSYGWQDALLIITGNLYGLHTDTSYYSTVKLYATPYTSFNGSSTVTGKTQEWLVDCYFLPTNHVKSPFTLIMPLPGTATTSNNTLTVQFTISPSLTSTDNVVYLDIQSSYVYTYERHTHTYTDAGSVVTGETEETMDYYIEDEGHVSTSYPSTMEIYIKNSTYTSWTKILPVSPTVYTGGSQKIGSDGYTSADIKSELTDGNNLFQIQCSDTSKGSVHLYGSILDYGVQ